MQEGDAFRDALEEVVDRMAMEWVSPREKISGTLRALLRGWLEELLCDHLAIEATGPVFLWAFAMFAMPLSYGAPGSEHPPNTVRLRLCLEHLRQRGWGPHVERIAPRTVAWLDSVAADAEAPLPPEYAFVRDQVLHNANIIRDIAAARVGDASLDREACESEADQAASLLSELILPLGLDTALDSRSILIGGWQRAFAEHGDSPSGMARAISDARLQDLLGKAMEMSVVVEAWEKA